MSEKWDLSHRNQKKKWVIHILFVEKKGGQSCTWQCWKRGLFGTHIRTMPYTVSYPRPPPLHPPPSHPPPPPPPRYVEKKAARRNLNPTCTNLVIWGGGRGGGGTGVTRKKNWAGVCRTPIHESSAFQMFIFYVYMLLFMFLLFFGTRTLIRNTLFSFREDRKNLLRCTFWLNI